MEKVLYPAGRFNKGQVIDYYTRVSKFLLPHLKDRPVTLKRFPDGVFGDFFYEKDAPGFTPEWVKRFPVPRREGGPDINYIVINDLPTLVWVANTASLELHPFLHRTPKIDRPTYIVLDLDPGEGADILQCCEVALLVKDLFQGLEMNSFAKVSGSKGIQVYVPLNTPVTYALTQPMARAIAEQLSRDHPKLIVANMAKALRRGRVFIDWSQNTDHKTTVAVYSLRAKSHRPYVSMPVTWEELERAARKSDREILYFEAEAALRRLEKLGDLFAPVLKLKQKLPEEFANAPQRKVPRSLRAYEAKRNFRRTPEPWADVPRRSAQGGKRRFVVQKHAASNLHYDLRLEMHDALKSWSVPKGISLTKGERRSAFATEDHPLGYLEFEGTIPEGQYGGGTVMVWDIGTYEVVEGNYYKGRLRVHFSGKKLKGEWLLERMDDEHGKRRWLITQITGQKKISARSLERSALSGRTLEEIANERSAVWQSNQRAARAARPARQLTGPPKGGTPNRTGPEFVTPMKPTLVSKLPEGNEWIYEVKWDGYRALALKHGERVQLISLKNKDLTRDFPSVAEAVRGVDAEMALIDGEIVAVNSQGRPSFQMLQNRASLGREWKIVYYAFDLLNLEGKDLRWERLEARKSKLKEAIAGSRILYNSELPGKPAAILREVERLGLEGVVAKRRDSPYEPGKRSGAWLKVRLDVSQEFVIGGYNPAGENFQSLLLGYYEGDKLMFAGKVRQGFNPAIRARLWKQIQPLQTNHCHFSNLPTSRSGHFGEGVTAEDMKKLKWLKPQLVAQVRFAEWTSYGLLRHATFIALRDDKSPREVVREEPRK